MHPQWSEFRVAGMERRDPAAWARPTPEDEERRRREEEERRRLIAEEENRRREPREREHGPVNRLAVTAFVLSVLPVVIGAPIAAIVVGRLALEEIEDSNGAERGAGLARWAIGIGVVLLVLSLVAAVLLAVELLGSDTGAELDTESDLGLGDP